MIRVYFLFEDPFDEVGINLSFVDVPTEDPTQAFQRVERSAESGELWKNLYPSDDEYPYKLIKSKMTYLDISKLLDEQTEATLLGV